jgi:dTDP-4-dehydrorhamnose 3,5-epimerase
MINIKQLSIPNVILIEPQVFDDERGFFFEAFNQQDFENAIKRNVNFVQDNHSRSIKGVLRGLHMQNFPYAQEKLIRVVNGKIFDVAVDLREGSKTFGCWIGEILSSDNKKQLWIPEGCAHGFLCLSDYADVVYKTNNYYAKDYEVSINPIDQNLGIKWPVVDNIILSKKDANGLSFQDFRKVKINLSK